MDMEYWERRGTNVLKDKFLFRGASWLKYKAHLKTSS